MRALYREKSGFGGARRKSGSKTAALQKGSNLDFN
jgi:hypothetical protein